MTAPRRAGAGDAAALAALNGGLPDPWRRDAIARELALPAARVWLLDEGGPPLGWLAARRAADELEVLALGVVESHRRRGLASRLLAAALAAEPGLARVQLEVRAGNRGALDFYAAQGFERVGRRARYYPDGEDAELLTRRLR